MKELLRIEDLLYGKNYQVWFNLYHTDDSDANLESLLQHLISEDCQVSGVVSSTPEDAEKEIMEMVLYKGDKFAGPIALEKKKEEIIKLMGKVFSLINLHDTDLVFEFGFKKGHPAYPVFWDFAFDIHSSGERWIFIGSSSD